MSNWKTVETEAPELAHRVRELFGRGMATIATLRRDGSPRISGTELSFVGGEVSLSFTGASVKLRDVRHDPRVAIHARTSEAPTSNGQWDGDAKIAGRLAEVSPGTLRLDLTEVALTSLSASGSPLIETWHEGRGSGSRAATF